MPGHGPLLCPVPGAVFFPQMTTGQPPRYSIIIPVYDRKELLRRCLDSLQAVVPAATAEVIVACDGGPGHMREAAEGWKGQWPLEWMQFDKTGPAATRNRAVEESRGEILLFLNDDVTLAPDFLAAHDEVHRRWPRNATCGNTRWDPRCISTDFMHWVAHHDHIYYAITDLRDIGWDYWHTLNASIHRCWFDDGHTFDETFPDPAFEDTEYAYRLSLKGLAFGFAAGALAWHDHFFTPDQYLEKSTMRGASAKHFLDKFPEQSHRILTEYEQALGGRRRKLRLHASRFLPLADGPAEWHARFAARFLAGFRGEDFPAYAARCR